MEKKVAVIFLFLARVLCGEECNFIEMEERIAKEMIISQIPMADFLRQKGHKVHFTSPVFLVELESGIQAVFKVAESDWPQDAVAESAAYQASQFLGIHLVPPTVIRSHEGAIGSLQLYVEPSFDLMADDRYELALQKADPEELANIQLFYFVFGQWDPDPSNLIAVEREGAVHFALIDNAALGFRQKVRYGEYPFVLCFPDTHFPSGEEKNAFPFDKARLLPNLPEVWKKEFGDVLSDKEITRLCRLKKPVSFVIWENRFWRQYKFGKPAFTEFYPDQTMKRLGELDLAKIKTFFQNDLGFSFSKEYYEDILERRDQIIHTYNE